MPVAGGLALAIRLRFHNHAPQQLPSGLALHQQAADEVGCDDFGRASEEGLGEVLGLLGWAWWLWEWLCEEMLTGASTHLRMGYN